MSKRIPIAFWILSVSALVVLCALGLPMLPRPTNCGGNSAALSACRGVVLAFQTVALDRGDRPFRVVDLSEAERENFRSPICMSWLPGARLLVTPEAISITQGEPKRIVAVCDRAYDNVPQHRFWKAPMTHAVGYSDGSVGLMPLAVFQHSDFSHFVDVATIPRTVSNQPHAADPR